MKKVLIVDDEPVIQITLKRFFESLGDFEVVGVGSDGNDAVELADKLKPNLITLDITMPNKDGIEALRGIIANNPNATVLMVSTLRDKDKISLALKIGAKGYINKPLNFRSEEYVNTIKDEINNALEE
ncbi:response regulator transcription factor [Candidatus Margulisiibacteriota bacterium]